MSEPRTGKPEDGTASSWASFVAIFALALAVRALVFFELHDSVLLDVLLGDAKGYVDWARTLHAGDWRGSEVFYQAPLYPYFIGLVFSATDGSVMGVRVLQLLLGSAACGWIALATARFFSREAGLAAGTLLALYPVAIFFDLIVLFEGDDPLPGLTLEVSQADSAGAEKQSWRHYQELSAHIKGETKQE